MDEKFDMGDRRPRCSASCGRRRRMRLGYLAVFSLVALAVVSFVRPGTLRLGGPWTLGGSASFRGGAEIKIPGALTTDTAATTHLVPLEAHIMSKCPDALDCMRDLVLPTMQRVVDKVNFTLSFIGTPTGDGGVECMHGPAECMGNILELCAAQLYPDPKIYLGFTMCLLREYHRVPDRDLVEDCALEHAVDIAQLDACATANDGQTAMDLLKRSVRHTRDVGVTKSCTVRLDNEVYCIRDGGEWFDCPSGGNVHDLIINIEKKFRL
ncbi:gamma interferon inducible lysosomal thiol reductase [Ophiostoma piceae UAMH 11346]|uniref:Gamma interferon inducible lysosomal thiol reductase n=1 Tax=Ophiostoma piceae (strain UAMH 11346) TaxID=1262450 RepID=S3BLY0_OPHP1|nr:gamma interferon inducible lysosomal thiol reductase [Ophiostoma piceae UAMH 11346]